MAKTHKKTLKEINEKVLRTHEVAIPPCGNPSCACAKAKKASVVAPINPGQEVAQPKYRSKVSMATEAYVGGFTHKPGEFEEALLGVLEEVGEPTPKQAVRALYRHAKRHAKASVLSAKAAVVSAAAAVRYKYTLLKGYLKAKGLRRG